MSFKGTNSVEKYCALRLGKGVPVAYIWVISTCPVLRKIVSISPSSQVGALDLRKRSLKLLK